MFIFNIKRIIKKRSFKIILLVFFVASVGDFILTCLYYKGSNLSEIPSAYLCTILSSEHQTVFQQVYSVLMLFLIPFACSDIILEDRTLGANNVLELKKGRGSYFFGTGAAIALLIFLVVAGSLLLNLVLVLTAFPIQGHYTSGLAAYKSLASPESDRIFSYFENFYPYINVLLNIFVRTIVAVGFGLFSYGISFLHGIKKYIVVIAPFIFYVGFLIITYVIKTVLGSFDAVYLFTRTNLFQNNGYGTIWFIVAYIAVEIMIGVKVIRKAWKDE